MSVACYHYDWTLPRDDWSHTEIIKLIHPKYVKKYTFQLEKGDSGYEHFQGRLSLIKKRRLTEACKLLKEVLPKIHLSVTSNNGLEDNFYVLKEDTKLEGAWSDTDPKPQFIPRQIREITKLKPWQQTVVDLSSEWNTRNINIILDTAGNIGKSILSTYMGVYGHGRQLPYCNDYKDIMRMVMDIPTSRCYLIDMPRAINKEKLFQMYGAIETVKSGYAYDDRYSFRDKYFDCPNIWVFTNTVPDFGLLSIDRWKLWEVKNDTLKEMAIGAELDL